MSATRIDPLAWKPAPASHLVDVPQLTRAYYTERPDPAVPEHSMTRHRRPAR